MSVTVKIPAQLRAATGGEGELEVEGSTVGEALDAVFDQHDGLRERITQDGDLRRFVNVYVSGEDIRFQDGLDTPVSEGDEVTILPAVAGGQGSPVVLNGTRYGPCIEPPPPEPAHTGQVTVAVNRVSDGALVASATPTEASSASG